MSMADDNTQRAYRSNDPYRRDLGSSSERDHAPASDPLAELARLIGQSDPFAQFGDNAGSSASAPAPRASAPPPENRPMRLPSTAPDWRKVAAAMPPFETPTRREPEPDEDLPPAPDAAKPVFPPRTLPRRQAAALLAEPAPAPRSPPLAPAFPPRTSLRMPAASVAAPPVAPRTDIRAPAPEPEEQPEADHEETLEVAAPAMALDSADLYYEDAPLSAEEEATYDDAPRARQHGRLLTAIVLIGCATLGTAAAYGYRTYFNSAGGSSQAAPVITADKTPMKVLATTGDAQSNKPIQDRMAEASANERMVSREEKPVDLASPGTAAVPRIVLPSPVTTSAFPPPPALATPPQAVAPAPAKSSVTTGTAPNPGEPKKVHTVAIKPDGSEYGSRAVAPPPNSPAAQVAARSITTTRTSSVHSAPLSLDPNAQAEAVEPAPPPPARTRNTAPPAARIASIAPTAGGGYMVQVSSQRSESEAHASFRSLQGKFKELAGREVVVRRADLGSKGTYYRAMVGPFGSAEEANHVCGNLKASGGQCIVQKN